MKKVPYLLVGIGAGLTILHLNLAAHSGDNDLFSGSLLFWVAGTYLIWSKSDRLIIKSNFVSALLGLSLINLVLFKSLHLFEEDPFLRLSPLISWLGLGLLASGWQGLKQYGGGLLLFTFLVVPWRLIDLFFNLSLLTAKFATALLWILGFLVSREGVLVILPTGSIEVYAGCSGIRAIAQLLGIALIFAVMFNPPKSTKALLFLLAIMLGFTLNALRVALMTVLVALGNEAAFAYWHLGDGSLVFSLCSVLIFGWICVKTRVTVLWFHQKNIS